MLRFVCVKDLYADGLLIYYILQPRLKASVLEANILKW